MSHLEAVDHPLSITKLNLYVVDPDSRYTDKLQTILQSLGVVHITIEHDYQSAITYLKNAPEAHNLIIVGATLINDDLIDTLEAISDAGVLAMLVLVPSIDAKGIRRILRSITSIKDCAEKTQDKRTIKYLIEDMVELINAKVVKALYPFGQFD